MLTRAWPRASRPCSPALPIDAFVDSSKLPFLRRKTDSCSDLIIFSSVARYHPKLLCKRLDLEIESSPE